MWIIIHLRHKMKIYYLYKFNQWNFNKKKIKQIQKILKSIFFKFLEQKELLYNIYMNIFKNAILYRFQVPT